MSKNNGFGKFLLFCTAVGAAAAGAYYYLSKREAEIADSFDEGFDDFDDFEDDLEDEIDPKTVSRKYVDIKSAGSESESEEKEEQEDSAEKAPSSSEEFFDDEDDKTED